MDADTETLVYRRRVCTLKTEVALKAAWYVCLLDGRVAVMEFMAVPHKLDKAGEASEAGEVSLEVERRVVPHLHLLDGVASISWVGGW